MATADAKDRRKIMANPSEMLQRNRESIRRIVSLHRTTNPRVFGSVLRGADTANSDLDLLVDPLPGATLLDLGAIQVELEEVLGVAVDVLTPSDLPEKFRAQVLQEAVPV
jgi:predicted nucleotidyltransferase